MKKKKEDSYEYFQKITPDGLENCEKILPPLVTKKTKESEESWYVFKGYVNRFDKCVIPKWEAKTKAVSLKKATTNFLFQAKKALNLAPNAGGIELKGDIKIVEEQR